VGILSGLHHLPMLVTKRTRKGGTLYEILQKISAGRCCHNKMKLLYGKRLVKEAAIVPGNATSKIFTCIPRFVLMLIEFEYQYGT
jgi:hypothetical protein